MTSLESSIEAVRLVMQKLPIEFVMEDWCPQDYLMHALTTMLLVEQERKAKEGKDVPSSTD